MAFNFSSITNSLSNSASSTAGSALGGTLSGSALAPPSTVGQSSSNVNLTKLDKLLTCNGGVTIFSFNVPAILVVVLGAELFGLLLWVVFRIINNGSLPTNFTYLNTSLRYLIMLGIGLYVQKSLYVRNMFPGLWPSGANNYSSKKSSAPSVAAMIAGAGGVAAAVTAFGGLSGLASAVPGGLSGLLSSIPSGLSGLASSLGGPAALLAAAGGGAAGLAGLTSLLGGASGLGSAIAGSGSLLSGLAGAAGSSVADLVGSIASSGGFRH